MGSRSNIYMTILFYCKLRSWPAIKHSTRKLHAPTPQTNSEPAVFLKR